MTAVPSEGGEFTADQKRYIEGFASGLEAGRAVRGATPAAPPAAPAMPAARSEAAGADTNGPDAAARTAQDRLLAQGGKLSDQEKFKRELHPFDGYDRLKAQAAHNEYPKPPDN